MSLFRRNAALKNDMAFATEFRQRFIDYAKSRGADGAAYHWMMMNSNKMQSQMGYAGILANFRDPPIIYPVILNILPRIKREFGCQLSDMYTQDLLQTFDDTLVRYIGDLERALNQSFADCRNPVRWFSTGVELILAVPLYFFSSFGVLSIATVHALQRTKFFKLCSALIGLLGLLASTISIT